MFFMDTKWSVFTQRPYGLASLSRDQQMRWTPGFTRLVLRNILSSLGSNSGKQLEPYSTTHFLAMSISSHLPCQLSLELHLRNSWILVVLHDLHSWVQELFFFFRCQKRVELSIEVIFQLFKFFILILKNPRDENGSSLVL